jgi:hypothetical protein
MRVLLVLVVLLLSQQISKPISSEGDSPKPSSNAQNNTPQGDKEMLRHCCQTNQDHRKGQNEKAEDEAKNRLYRWYVYATVIGSGVAVLALIVLICQTIATRNNSAALLSIEGAWVTASLEEQKFLHNLGQGKCGIDVVCLCQNTGRTPAWVLEIDCKLEFVDTLRGLIFSDLPTVRYQPESIATGEKRTYTFELRCSGSGEFLVAYGVVKYTDIFNRNRRTTFAYRILENCVPVRIATFREYNKNT